MTSLNVGSDGLPVLAKCSRNAQRQKPLKISEVENPKSDLVERARHTNFRRVQPRGYGVRVNVCDPSPDERAILSQFCDKYRPCLSDPARDTRFPHNRQCRALAHWKADYNEIRGPDTPLLHKDDASSKSRSWSRVGTFAIQHIDVTRRRRIKVDLSRPVPHGMQPDIFGMTTRKTKPRGTLRSKGTRQLGTRPCRLKAKMFVRRDEATSKGRLGPLAPLDKDSACTGHQVSGGWGTVSVFELYALVDDAYRARCGLTCPDVDAFASIDCHQHGWTETDCSVKQSGSGKAANGKTGGVI